MKATLINLLILLAFAIAYYLDIFGWFTKDWAIWVALSAAGIVFIVGVIILGNPLAKEKNNEEK